MLSEGPFHDATDDDSTLLERLRTGDAEAWGTLAATFRQRLRDMAASTLPAEVTGRADASDIVQQTLCEAHEAFSAFHGKSLQELYVWLAAILSNNVNDAVREHIMAQRRTVRSECRLVTPKALNSKAQGRREAHPGLQDKTTLVYAEGVTQPVTIRKSNTFGVNVGYGFLNPGCAARPRASECNRFAVVNTYA